MSFYRIYRPQVIDEIDNIAVREALLRLLTKPKKDLPHAYLFSGPRGAGKTTAARLIAKLYNCQKPSKIGPCGACDQCVSIAAGRNLDVLEIDAASNRGIDEIRQLRDAISLAPVSAAFRIYIIDEVHMLTTEAFNALLKTLEEPPAHAVFILATTDPQKVPVTIQSRCVSLIFSKATDEELESALTRIVQKEKIDINAEGLHLIAKNVDGSFRDAVKCLEQISFHKGTVSVDVVRGLLSISGEKIRDEFLDHLAKQDAKAALTVVESIVSDGKDVRLFLVDCLTTLHQYLIDVLPSSWNKETITVLIRKLSQAFVEMKGSAISQLPLELAIIEYCQSEIKPVHKEVIVQASPVQAPIDGLLTLEKIVEHWPDVIAELKPYNHSVAGVMRSTRPKEVNNGIVTIEAFYTFHKDKLSESKTKDVLAAVLKKLFGEKVKVEIVLGKK